MKNLILFITAFCAFVFYACKKDSPVYPPPIKPVVDTSPPFRLQNMMYPNPCNSAFYIQTNATDTQYVTISDGTGRTILNTLITTNHTTIVTQSWTSGVYFLRFSGKWGISTHKIIVVH
ncbi:MAG: T9SS type A sorting domain-containing protein [Bacteroidetes bacterium]|nr:T9SS type A sorting domain-containing protein [Bacteroidota bacterium]